MGMYWDGTRWLNDDGTVYQLPDKKTLYDGVTNMSVNGGPTAEVDPSSLPPEDKKKDLGSSQDQRAADFINTLKAEFPWLDAMGLDPTWFQNTAAEASGPAEILVKIRQTPQYKARFPGMYRKDGSVRMNEAQYLQTESTYRNLLRQYGFNVDEYATPGALVGFFDSEMDGRELESRLRAYTTIKQSSQSTKDAFYVYAGLDVSDEDLYSAMVDPAARQNLVDAYNAKIAGQAFDYQTFITRATEVGNQRVAKLLTDMKKTGAVTGAAVQAVLNTDPNFARTIMDALYTGGGMEGATTLNLDELLSAFEEAALGAAATNAGLSLPTKERIAQLRTAGVQKAQAQESYMAFGQNKGIYSAAVQRAGLGDFTQRDFENAAFLGDAKAAQTLAFGMATEEAAGKDQGEFRFREEANRIVQAGLR